MKLENLHWQGWAGIIYVNIFYLKWLWEGMKTPSFAHEIGESALAGVGRNNICEYLLFEMALGRHENTKFCTQSALAGVGRNNMWISSIWNGFGKTWKHQVLHTKLENLHWQGWAGIICEYLLFEMAGKAWKHQVLHTKLENLHWQGWAGIIYVNIFYLKWLWEGMKTPSFAHEIGESALAGVGRNNVCEYLLFEMALERHENTKCCTQNWGIMYVNILYLKWLWEAMKNTKFCTQNWRICTGRGGQE